jgi:hypothetical protein
MRCKVGAHFAFALWREKPPGVEPGGLVGSNRSYAVSRGDGPCNALCTLCKRDQLGVWVNTAIAATL